MALSVSKKIKIKKRKYFFENVLFTNHQSSFRITDEQWSSADA